MNSYSKSHITAVSIASIRLPDYSEYAIARVVKGVCDYILAERDLDKERIDSAVDALIQTHRLAYPVLAEWLGNAGVPAKADVQRMIRDIQEKTQSERDTETIVQQYENLANQLITQCSALVNGRTNVVRAAAAQDVAQLPRQHLVRRISIGNSELAAETLTERFDAQINRFDANINGLRTRHEQAEQAQHQATLELIDARRALFLFRSQKVNAATQRLAERMLARVKAWAQLESSIRAIEMLRGLSEQSSLYGHTVTLLRESVREAEASARHVVSNHPPFLGEHWNVITQPALDREELDAIMTEQLTFTIDEPPGDVLLRLAEELRSLIPTWPECTTQQLWEALWSAFATRLAPLADLTIEEVLRRRAEREKKSPEEIGSELMRVLDDRVRNPWLQVRRAELPDEGTVVITNIGVPSSDVADNFFPQSNLRSDAFVRGVSSPFEILAVKIEAGLHKESLRMWNVYLEALTDSAKNDPIPILPPGMLSSVSGEDTRLSSRDLAEATVNGRAAIVNS